MIRLHRHTLDDAKRGADYLLRDEGAKVAVYTAAIGVGFVILDEVGCRYEKNAFGGTSVPELEERRIYNPERRAHQRVAFRVPVHVEVVEPASA